MNQNPLLIGKGLPLFEEISAEHVVPAVETILDTLETELSELESNGTPTWEGVMQPLSSIEERLGWVWGVVSHLMSVKNSDALREAHAQVEPAVIAFSIKVSQSRRIFELLTELKESSAWSTLTKAQHRIIEQSLTQAKLAGIGLEGEAKQRFSEIASELGELSTRFSNNVLDATKAFKLMLTDESEIAGLPETLLATAAARAQDNGHPDASKENGPWCITLDTATFIPFMTYSERADLRKEAYIAFIGRASSGPNDNTPLIEKILQLRKEKAELLGFSSYAEVSLSRKMANTPDEVGAFLEDLRSKVYSTAIQEEEELVAFAESQGATTIETEMGRRLPPWSTAYWTEKLKVSKFDLSEELLRQYFPLDNALDGLFQLLNRIFGVTVKPADGQAQVWHPDVRFYCIEDASGEPQAYFFLDQFSRPGSKRGGAWMGDCLGRKVEADGSIQLPVAYLNCNATPPSGETPSLLTFNQVTTLFHETGHGLQHMLTQVEFAEAAGINGVEWDAVELPSQFMENWCYERKTLFSMAKHYQTQEALPEEIYQNILAARKFRSASMLLRQLKFGITDYHLHYDFDPKGDLSIRELEKQLATKLQVSPFDEQNHRLCSFGHIFAGGYAFGYYSYLWADVLSSDAFAAFEERGLDQEDALQELGMKFKNTVLGLGGSEHPLEVFRQFRGREPQPEPFLKSKGLA